MEPSGAMAIACGTLTMNGAPLKTGDRPSSTALVDWGNFSEFLLGPVSRPNWEYGIMMNHDKP
jgi:hypothetical protein